MTLPRLRGSDVLYFAVLFGLTTLAVVPFWRTRLLPFQDYPHILVFARAMRDASLPSSPFHGTYETGYPVAPLVLPLLLLRGLWLFTSLETAGKLLWSCHVLATPLAAHSLLRVLGRDRWAVLLVFPLLFSYWCVGGFFGFATSTPLVLYGLSVGLRWLLRPSRRLGIGLATLLAATFLWHALAFAQFVFYFGLLWLLWRAPSLRDRARALLPLAPSLVLYAAWVLFSVRTATMSSRPTAWPPFAENVLHFFEFIGPIMPNAVPRVLLLGLFVLGARLFEPMEGLGTTPSMRVKSPFAWLAFAAVLCYLVLPATTLGVEGIHNRFAWWACLLLTFAWSLPKRPVPRAIVGTIGVAASALVLLHMGRSFAEFDEDTAGANVLLDRLKPHQTLFAPLGSGATSAFPGKPMIGLGLYASIRNGSLPSTSFAAYDINFIHYAGGEDPMPDLPLYGTRWLDDPALPCFDYVLLRGPYPEASARDKLVVEATHGLWTLASVCGSSVRPTCPETPHEPDPGSGW